MASNDFRVRLKFHNDFWDQIGFLPGVETVLDQVTDKAIGIAKNTAPVATGKYRDSISKTTTHSPKRIVKQMVANDPKAVFIEARTSNLRRAALQARGY